MGNPASLSAPPGRPGETLHDIARDLNTTARRYGGLTHYVYRENEEKDVDCIAAALHVLHERIKRAVT